MKTMKLLSSTILFTILFGCTKNEIKDFDKIAIIKNNGKQTLRAHASNTAKVAGGENGNCDWVLVMEPSGSTGSGTSIVSPIPMECKAPFGHSCKCSAGAIKIPFEIFQLYFENVTPDNIYTLDINSNEEFIAYLQGLGY